MPRWRCSARSWYTATSRGEINVVAPGGANNLWSPFLIHMTFDANGNLTSSTIDFPPPTCRQHLLNGEAPPEGGASRSR